MTNPHSQRAHAVLGASSAYRWMNCPGSVRLCAPLPERSSAFAREGTAAHELGERCLNNGYSADRFLGETVSVEGEDFEIDDDMVEAVQVYLDTVRAAFEPGDTLMVETRFDLSAIYPGCFGTNDAAIYKPKQKRLIVFDYKHGRGVPVDVIGNLQLRYYGLGAALANATIAITDVEIVIVQPRCFHPDGPVRREVIAALDLIDWAGELIAACERTAAPDAPLAAGDWCKFCPAAGVCPALAEQAALTAQADFADPAAPVLPEPSGYDAESLGRVLRGLPLIEDWCKRVREFADGEANAGRVPPGWKMVQGTPGRRGWKDEEAAVDFLRLYGLDDKDIYAEPKLRSPAQIEKVVGRKSKDDIASLVARPSGRPVLAPIEDSRPAIASAAEDFAEAAE